MGEDFYRRQREAMGGVLAEQNVVITTAAVPGKKAPILITREMVERMAPGSVVVDIAAERGGNCELTRPGETVDHSGVSILGPLNLPSTVPYHASQMYAKNIATFLKYLIGKDGQSGARPRGRNRARNAGDARGRSGPRQGARTHGPGGAAGRLTGASMDLDPWDCSCSCWRPSSGLEIIRKVSPLLHTPLMSLTNAISAISVVGAILITGAARRHHAQQGAGLHRHYGRGD